LIRGVHRRLRNDDCNDDDDDNDDDVDVDVDDLP
jgi:hypothetical protein